MSEGAAAITIIGIRSDDLGLADDVAAHFPTVAHWFVRDAALPVVATAGREHEVTSFNDYVDQASNVSDAVDQFVATIIDAAGSSLVGYVTAGSPLAEDAIARGLARRAGSLNIAVQVSSGSSCLESLLPRLPDEALGPGLQLVDALDLALVGEREPFSGGELPLSSMRPTLVIQLQIPAIREAALRALGQAFPGDATVFIATGESIMQRSLRDLSSDADGGVGLDTESAIYLPPVDPLRHGLTSDALRQIVARLRAPGGCPWDREQTHRSLMQSGIEEAYEVLDAIERGDVADMQEELGDLLLLAYMHAQIAAEAAEFSLEDVYQAVTSKLVRRHPHVFGDAVANNASDVLQNWDAIKRDERAARGRTEDEHPLGNIPIALPALARAQTVVRRAGRQGLVAISALDASSALGAVATEGASPAQIAEALLTIAQRADELGIDAEQLLRERTRRIEDDARRSIQRRQGSNSTQT